MLKYLILLACVIMALGKDDPKYDTLYHPSPAFKQPVVSAQEMHWFTQVVDHYDYRQEQHFQQRYWVVQDYFDPRIGPVFLYICGEWVCSGVPELRTWIGVLAQKMHALILVV
jgi:hypothetical protein